MAVDCRAPHSIVQVLKESFADRLCPLPLSPIGSWVSPNLGPEPWAELVGSPGRAIVVQGWC